MLANRLNGHAQAGPAPIGGNAPAPSGQEQSQPLAVDEREAARLLGISQRTLWGLADAGKVRAVKIGTRKLYPVSELQRYLQAQLDAQGPPR